MNQEYDKDDYGDYVYDIPAANAYHQPIDVDATFTSGKKCTPTKIYLKNGREIEITEVGLIHPRYNGLKTKFLFDVTDGILDYRISFDTETLEWFLEWE